VREICYGALGTDTGGSISERRRRFEETVGSADIRARENRNVITLNRWS